MRSQKQSNKTPRPFKNKGSGRDWSGGSRSSGFIPAPKPKPKMVNKTDAPPPLEPEEPAKAG